MSETAINRQWLVARLPGPDELIGPEHFRLVESEIPEPADGEFLLRTLVLGTSPAQRGYLVAGAMDKGSIAAGEVMRGRGVGVVEKSRHPDFAAGDIVVASTGWQDYSVQQPRDDFVMSVRRLADPPRPLSMALGMLGQAGVTAWFGLTGAGQLRAGDTVVITAAAGGVGVMVGQLARILGAGRVIGITGSDDKCRWLTEEIGFDDALNYRSADLDAELGRLCPDGADVVFDNVGGELLNTLLNHLAMHARVAIAGFIATDYSTTQTGPINYRNLVARRARMEGFVVFDEWERFADAERKLAGWFADGLLKPCEDIDQGLERMPESLQSLFTGGNRGIRLCRVAPDPTP